jgi:hypothetical protein
MTGANTVALVPAPSCPSPFKEGREPRAVPAGSALGSVPLSPFTAASRWGSAVSAAGSHPGLTVHLVPTHPLMEIIGPLSWQPTRKFLAHQEQSPGCSCQTGAVTVPHITRLGAQSLKIKPL